MSKFFQAQNLDFLDFNSKILKILNLSMLKI